MPEKHVIVADDTAFVRERFCAALVDAGHRATAVRTVGELLHGVRTHEADTDLVLLDLHLPHSRGVDLVRSIRSYDDGRIAIVVFSGTILSADEVRELAALGVAGYVNEYSLMAVMAPLIGLEMLRWVTDRPAGDVWIGLPFFACAALQGAAALIALRFFLRHRVPAPAAVEP